MKMLSRARTFVICISILFSNTTATPQSSTDSSNLLTTIGPALDSIKGENILQHIKVLASDEFEGRAPGTKGEIRTVDYLVEQFRRYSLKPGNPDGTYLQKVPLVGFTAEPKASFKVGGKTFDLNFPDDYVARSRRLLPEVTVENSEVIFVGYGIVAPEYGWDDYKNVDARGKTVVVLDNDPQIFDPLDPSKLDEKIFKGRALTYYGTRSYKYEAAAQKGASAVLIVHDPVISISQWKNLRTGYLREAFEIKQPVAFSKPASVEGWLTLNAARKLFAEVNIDFNSSKKLALDKNFKPISLRAVANFNVKSTLREIDSYNVVAKIDGSDKRLKDQYVIYTAHWDHLGRDEKLSGDQIYNGAIDNAGGVAQMLEIAAGFAKLKKPPKRSIVFIATTAEERGLLGAKYYVANPLYPLSSTLANINLDSVNLFGRTKDVIDASFGLTTLDEILSQAAATQNRVLLPDPFPEGGYLFRSDQFEFVRAGIPAIFPGSGLTYIGKPANYGEQKWGEYDKDYHQVSDEVKPDWEMSGAVEDAQWLLQVGYRVAQAKRFPEWNLGSEFKARRDEMLHRKRK